jgi:hypothetical protein
MLTTAGSTNLATSAKLPDIASGTFLPDSSPALARRSDIATPIPIPTIKANAVKTESKTNTFRKILRSSPGDSSSAGFNISNTPLEKN